MEDTSQINLSQTNLSQGNLSQDNFLYSNAMNLGKLLDDHRAGNVIVMDMRNLNYWTDFFIIGTVTSNTHMTGLERHIKDYAVENDLTILRSSRKNHGSEKSSGLRYSERDSFDQDFQGKDPWEPGSTEFHSEEWRLLDLGEIVIHLMTEKLRQFFELERLWSAATIIYTAHSSKSS